MQGGPTGRLFYVDDSGAAASGYIVYSWIECTMADWRVGLRSWLDLRKDLYARYAIPPTFELDAAHFTGGRGSPQHQPQLEPAQAQP
jgi:hypothetical protein